MTTLSHVHRYLLGIIMLGSVATLYSSQGSSGKDEVKASSSSAAYLVRAAMLNAKDAFTEIDKLENSGEKTVKQLKALKKYSFYEHIKPCYEPAQLSKLPWIICALHRKGPSLNLRMQALTKWKMPALEICFDTTVPTADEVIQVDHSKWSNHNFTTTLAGALSGAQLLPSSSYNETYLYPSGAVSAAQPGAGDWLSISLYPNSIAFVGNKNRTYYVRRIKKGEKPVVHGLEIDSRVPKNDKESARGGRIAIFPCNPKVDLRFEIACDPQSMLFDDQVQKPAQDSAWFTTATMSLKLEPKEEKSK